MLNNKLILEDLEESNLVINYKALATQKLKEAKSNSKL
ncbi:Hypothetical protein BN2458_PEG1156 [Helicobacter typhlonius]|uniref:Uncharacterized protein n=1 Tax=Helicobacter typhlonius TaxID=76936 RepID=A0A0S4PUX4_9HELI|nr:Hypothetical protein BN2458_PEG1156 [Helicobacter typhlonius]